MWDLEDLKRRMERLIDEEEDHIRYYGLCPKEISGFSSMERERWRATRITICCDGIRPLPPARVTHGLADIGL